MKRGREDVLVCAIESKRERLYSMKRVIDGPLIVWANMSRSRSRRCRDDAQFRRINSQLSKIKRNLMPFIEASRDVKAFCGHVRFPILRQTFCFQAHDIRKKGTSFPWWGDDAALLTESIKAALNQTRILTRQSQVRTPITVYRLGFSMKHSAGFPTSISSRRSNKTTASHIHTYAHPQSIFT